MAQRSCALPFVVWRTAAAEVACVIRPLLLLQTVPVIHGQAMQCVDPPFIKQ